MLGEGILKGLAETAKNFVGSFVSKERMTTVQYPEERIEPIENTRDFPFLVYDGDDKMAGLRCVACQICEYPTRVPLRTGRIPTRGAVHFMTGL